MRIVHVSPSYAPCIGGSERMLQAVSERLVARGHAVTVLTLDCATQRDFPSGTGAGLPPCEPLNGVKIIRVSPSGGGFLSLLEWWLRRRGGWRTMTWLLGNEFDYALSRPSGLGIILPLFRLKADVVGTVNWGFGVVFWVCHSLRLPRVPHVAIPVLHVDRPWAQRKLYPRLFKTCTTAIDSLKGVPTLVEAMRIVWQNAPETVLLIAGPRSHRDRATSDKLHALSESERQRVLLIDDFADREGPSIIEACDLLAQPSVEEAFGLVLLEAWMCGKPVIGADIAATRCLVDHGVDGWLVAPFDPADLAARILSLLADPETRATFGRRGRAKVLSCYTWERITDIWEATYRTVVTHLSPLAGHSPPAASHQPPRPHH